MASISTDISRVLTFWFDDPDAQHNWFAGGPAFDERCRTKLGRLVAQARTNALDDWAGTADGSLALLILLDQIPRNIFRDKAEAFASDEKALVIALAAIAAHHDETVALIRQSFFFLPLTHHEDLMTQVASWGMYYAAVVRARDKGDAGSADFAARMAAFAKKHLDVIRDFGRFPARNEALGRESTEAEKEFLKQNPGGLYP